MNMKTGRAGADVEPAAANKDGRKGARLAMFITKKHIPRRTFLRAPA